METRLWINFWNLKKNPFSTDPLTIEDKHFYELFTKTKEIEQIEPIFLDNIESFHLKKLVILGGRGSGKSTIINHLFLRFKSLKLRGITDERYSKYLMILPLIARISNIASYNDEKSLSNAFYEAILKGLSNSLDDITLNPNKAGTLEIRDEIEKCLKEDPSKCYYYASNIFKELVNQHFFSSFILFIDNLDKVTNEELLENWITHAQGFFEELWNSNVHTVVVGGGFFIVKSYDAEFSWFFDDVFPIEKWDFEDIKDLIDKRLKYRTLFGDNYKLEKYIEEDALRDLYQRCLGIPRICQTGLRNAMSLAAERNYKPINIAFILSNKKIFNGILGVNEKEERETFIDHLKTHYKYREGFHSIVTMLRSHRVEAPLLIKNLLDMYKNNNFSKIGKPEKFIRYSIVEENKQKKEYWLNKNVYRVIQDISWFYEGEEKDVEKFLFDLAR